MTSAELMSTDFVALERELPRHVDRVIVTATVGLGSWAGFVPNPTLRRPDVPDHLL